MDDHQGAKRRDLHTSWPIKAYTIWYSGYIKYAVSANESQYSRACYDGMSMVVEIGST